MCNKTRDELDASCDVTSERAPARRLARLAARTCLVGCGTLLAIPLGLILFGFVWQWWLNRNPEPFPWRPEREWKLPNVPLAFDFVEADGNLIVLSGTSVLRCDVDTGKILSEHALPFEGTALAVSPHSDSVVIAGVPSSSHYRFARQPGELASMRRQVVRIASVRLSDWAIEAEVIEEINHSGSSYQLADSLRAVAMPTRRTWLVGVPDLEQGTYRVSLRDQESLTERTSQTVLLEPSATPILGIAGGLGDASTVLIGTTGHRSYPWVLWETETGEVTFTETQAVPSSLEKPQRKTRSAWCNTIYLPPFCPSHLPDDVILSSCLLGSERDYRGVSVISRGTSFVANAMIVETQGFMLPVPPIRTYLAIWDAKSGKLLAAGILQGEANVITTLRFSNDNRFLVTGHNDGAIRLWKLACDPGDVSGRDGISQSATPEPRTNGFPDESPSASSDETLPAAEATTPPLAVAPLDAETARQHQEAWAKHLGVEVEMENSIGMKLVLIPPGEFLMGSPESEAQRWSHETQHRVRITKPYYLGMYEVTQGQWERVMAWNVSQFKGALLPVERVSWEKADGFCLQLSWTSEEQSAGRVYRLPTEAEWEYACRAGTTTPFHFGSQLKGREANCNGEYPYGTTTKGTYLRRTTTVGSYAANAFGLYDMHGNVWEWCADWYGEYPRMQVDDPTGSATGFSRVLRGGSWNFDAKYCRSAYRLIASPSSWHNHFGFRLALSVPERKP